MSIKLIKFSIAPLLFVTSIAVNAVPFLTLDNSIDLYNSGTNLDGSGIDQSFWLSSIDGSATNQDMSVTSASFLSPNTTDSSWISHAGNTSLPNTTYGASTNLDLTGIDLSIFDFSLTGHWNSDNVGLDILVNGVSTGQGNSSGHTATNWNSLAGNAFEINSVISDLISGMNTIEFIWENGTPTFTSFSPVSMRVEFDSIRTTQTVPEPSIIALFVLGIAGLSYSRKRRLLS